MVTKAMKKSLTCDLNCGSFLFLYISLKFGSLMEKQLKISEKHLLTQHVLTPTSVAHAEVKSWSDPKGCAVPITCLTAHLLMLEQDKFEI